MAKKQIRRDDPRSSDAKYYRSDQPRVIGGVPTSFKGMPGDKPVVPVPLPYIHGDMSVEKYYSSAGSPSQQRAMNAGKPRLKAGGQAPPRSKPLVIQSRDELNTTKETIFALVKANRVPVFVVVAGEKLHGELQVQIDLAISRGVLPQHSAQNILITVISEPVSVESGSAPVPIAVVMPTIDATPAIPPMPAIASAPDLVEVPPISSVIKFDRKPLMPETPEEVNMDSVEQLASEPVIESDDELTDDV